VCKTGFGACCGLIKQRLGKCWGGGAFDFFINRGRENHGIYIMAVGGGGI
jgi:hypothetical protein